MNATLEPSPRPQIYGKVPPSITDEVMRRMIEEYTGEELAQILRAMSGVPEPEKPRVTITDSPWPYVAFWLAAAAVLIVWMLLHASPHL